MTESSDGLPESIEILDGPTSLVAIPINEGTNACRAAGLATWALGRREALADIFVELTQLGFSTRLLERQPSNEDNPLERLQTATFDEEPDSARVRRWESLANSARLDDAVVFLVELLRSPLERESATAASALWRILASPESPWQVFRFPRWSLTDPNATSYPDDLTWWDGYDWEWRCWNRLTSRWASRIRAVSDLLRQRLGRALRSTDPITREIAAAAFAPVNLEQPAHLQTPQPNQQHANAVSTMVHGTWAWRGDWWRPTGDFFQFIHCHHRSDLYQRGARFSWDGSLRGSHRQLAAQDLVDWATDRAPAGLRTVFAHSYGGEVVALAARNRLPVDEIVLLSTPVTESVQELPDLCSRVVDVRIPFDIVLGLTGHRQRLPERHNVTGVIIDRWFWSHSASHSADVWQKEDVSSQAGM